jgi:circadian clock protein KaiB
VTKATTRTATRAKTVRKRQTRAFNATPRLTERRYELCLFIAGTTPLSVAALTNVVSICEEHLPERYDLVVVDVYQQPARAKSHQIIAVPTLLKNQPLPARRLIGDLSDRVQVLSGLGLPADPPAGNEKRP